MTAGRPAQAAPTFEATDYTNVVGRAASLAALQPSAEQTVLWTADDVARRWGVPRSTVYRLVRSGELPVLKLGKHFRWRLETIVAWEAAREGRADE